MVSLQITFTISECYPAVATTPHHTPSADVANPASSWLDLFIVYKFPRGLFYPVSCPASIDTDDITIVTAQVLSFPAPQVPLPTPPIDCHAVERCRFWDVQLSRISPPEHPLDGIPLWENQRTRHCYYSDCGQRSLSTGWAIRILNLRTIPIEGAVSR